MGLETATYIDGLDATNPAGSDQKKQGDDHLRLIKAVLKATFPNADKAIYFPSTAVKSADFTILATDREKTFLVTTASATIAAVLPTLTSADAGWSCHFIKTNTGTNPLFIVPASGTLTSGSVPGLAKARRCIPNVRTSAFWTGTAWHLTRAVEQPPCSVIEFMGTTLPVGYEWPRGQSLTNASTDYPEFYLVNGNSAVVKDLRGKTTFVPDTLAGFAAGLLTSTYVTDPNTVGGTGGAQKNTLARTDLPNASISMSGSQTLAHESSLGGAPVAPAGGSIPSNTRGDIATFASYSTGQYGSIVDHTVNFANASFNLNGGVGQTDISNLPPMMIMNKIVVVE